MNKIYASPQDLPKLTEKGYELVAMPPKIWESLLQMNNVLKQLPFKEESEDEIIKKSIIHPMWLLDYFAKYIHKELQPIFEWWCKEPLIMTARYGIRSYLKGAILNNHLDWVNSHHVSGIMMIDKDLNGNKDWPLQFQDHNGQWNDIYRDPGQMLLYESAICAHGREMPFQGKSYTNCYFHFKLKNWDFLPTNNREVKWNPSNYENEN